MPVRVNAWACKFKCGHKVQTSKARMVVHERECFLNPERRACQTCLHNDGDEFGFDCLLERRPTSRYVCDCEWHKLKGGDS